MQAADYRLQASWITQSAADTFDHGRQYAAGLAQGDVLAFSGHLGSGKTTLIQGICQGLGVSEFVTSPTFTLINEYSGRLPVYHFDFYRLDSTAELTDLGVEEYLGGDGVCLIEWPELIEAWLPGHHTWLQLSHGVEAAPRIHQLQEKSSSRPLLITADVRLIEVYRHEPAGH